MKNITDDFVEFTEDFEPDTSQWDDIDYETLESVVADYESDEKEKIRKSDKDRDQLKELNRLKYLFQNSEFLKRIEGVRGQSIQALIMLAEEFSLDYYEGSPLDKLTHDPSFRIEDLDCDPNISTCILHDIGEELFNPEDNDASYNQPVKQNVELRTSFSSYPIMIGLNPFASANDLIAFVKRNKPTIDAILSRAKNTKLPRKKREVAKYRIVEENMGMKSDKLADKIQAETGDFIDCSSVNTIKHLIRIERGKLK